MLRGLLALTDPTEKPTRVSVEFPRLKTFKELNRKAQEECLAQIIYVCSVRLIFCGVV